MLSWEEYVKKGMIRKAKPDLAVINSLVKTADSIIETISQLKLNEKTYLTIFKNYYDSLRSVCEAVALSKEYKIYQHEAIGLFLKNILKEEAISYKFDKFRVLRNGLVYYGREIEFNEVKLAVNEITCIIKELKNRYLKNDYKQNL